jgi:ABC-type multidrug transport system fused ATPase/permease subunit
MLETLGKIRDLLEPGDFYRLLLVLGMLLVAGVAETASVASIMPFMAVLTDSDSVQRVDDSRLAAWFLSPAYTGLGFNTTETFLIFLGVVVLVCVISGGALKMLATWAMLSLTSKLSYTLSRRLLNGYLLRPYSWFLGRHSADLGKTVLSEVDQVISGALVPAMQLINQVIILLFLIAMLVIVEAALALPFVAVLGGAYGLIFLGTRRYLQQTGEIRVQANAERFRLSSEAFGGIKEVKVFGLEEAFSRRFEEPARLFVRAGVIRELITQIPQLALRTIAVVGILLIVQYQLVLHGDLGQALPLIALFVVAGSRLMPSLQGVYHSCAKLRFAKAAVDVVHRDLVKRTMIPPSSRDIVSRGAPFILTDRVELRHVSYWYPDVATPALDDVSLTIPARALVGLVGQTGAGKTTLADVISGLLNLDNGQMLVDGAPIGADTRDWQRCVGFVPQHIFLADESIAANIAFGIPPAEIDMLAVEMAARVANLHDFVIELTRGYDTLIGERGVRLSGGERQRIGIARALYRDPALLVMDEATNALDTITERAVMDAVANLLHQKTIILIAHRIATVRRCDIIFFLERGRIVASGSYDALVNGSVRFREMVNCC